MEVNFVPRGAYYNAASNVMVEEELMANSKYS